MKKLLIAMVTALVTACATFGVPAPETFNQKVAVSISTVTVVRTLATNLLVAKKITAEDAKNIQEQADNARAGIVVAQSYYAQDPGNAENRIDAVLTILNGLQAYLQTKQ